MGGRGLKRANRSRRREEDSKGSVFVTRYARKAKHQRSTVTDKHTLPRHMEMFASKLGGLFSIQIFLKDNVDFLVE